MATLQGKAVKNTYRQVLQIGANNVGVSSTLQPIQRQQNRDRDLT